MNFSLRATTVSIIAISVSAAGFWLVNPGARTQNDVARLLRHLAGGRVSRFGEADRARFQAFVNTLPFDVKDHRDGMQSVGGFRWTFFSQNEAYVWHFRSGSATDYLILLNPQPEEVPSAAHAWLFIVDDDGQVLSQCDFEAGWRMYFKSASFGSVPWLPSPVLIEDMEPGLTRKPPDRFVIGFDGLRPATVRVELQDGSLRKLPYFAENWLVGPDFQPPKVDKLVSILRTGDEVQRLEALTWLYGHHSREADNRPNYAHEDTKLQLLYAEAIKSAQIAQAVTDLRKSKNAYIRQIASLIPLGTGDHDQPWQ